MGVEGRLVGVQLVGQDRVWVGTVGHDDVFQCPRLTRRGLDEAPQHGQGLVALALGRGDLHDDGDL
jgi:hypothetical protein